MNTTDAKKSPLGFLGSLLFEDHVKPNASSPPVLTPLQPMGSSPASSPPTAFPGAPDPQALARLEAMLREAMPAPYKAFLEQYEKLNGVIPDESLRFKAALATSNCIREDILKAIDTGLGTMAKALQDFQRAYESKKNNIEQALKQGTATVTEGIRAKNAQIQALQAEVQQLEQSLRQSEVKAQAEQAGLDNVRAGFEAAHAQVVRFLEMQRQQMPGGV